MIQYVILEAGVDDEMAEMGLAMGYYTKRTAKEMAQLLEIRSTVMSR